MKSASTAQSKSKSQRCTHATLSARGEVHLPVLAEHDPRGTIRQSKSGKRRAIVLVAVQLLLIIHIVIWALSRKYGWFGGATITPIEPSESMQFAKNGIINAGLIFFAVALLSTLVLGRWFCGWGCHIVMLQDFCGWIMKKCGVRPRAFRSRFLMYVPLALAIYMFVLPAVHRWWLVPLDKSMAASLGAEHWVVRSMRAVGEWTGFPLTINLSPWATTTHLTTTEFWSTFPTVLVAIPFLLVCGFAVVYFLGAKGFCTYGCPYGGFFAPLDKIAVGKIRVTDACEHCGHCTAVCTSNVRVHEEVREYGMVVDPGCMKCLDCVSVCPNDALYFGFGAPAVLKGPAKNATPKRVFDLTLGEEIAGTLVFIGVFIAVRGAYGVVPMLMAAGLAGILTFLTWKVWRMVRGANVTLHHFQLKFKGSVRPVGWLVAAITVAALALVIDCGAVSLAMTQAQRIAMRATMPSSLIFSQSPMKMDETMTADADSALRWLERASSIREGGWSLFSPGLWQADLDMRKASLLSAKLRFDEADRVLQKAIERDGINDSLCNLRVWVLHGGMRSEEAEALAEMHLIEHADLPMTMQAYLAVCGSEGIPDRAADFCRRRMEKFPDNNQVVQEYATALSNANRPEDRMNLWRQRLAANPKDLFSMRMLSLDLFFAGELAESAKLIEQTIEIDSSNPAAFFYLGTAYARQGLLDQAIDALAKGLKKDSDNVPLNDTMGQVLQAAGREAEAQRYFQKAKDLQGRQGTPQSPSMAQP